MLPYFEIFGRVVPMYGVCFVIGMGLAVLTAWLLARRFKEVPQIDVTCSAVYTGIGAEVGAKLLFIIVNLPLIISGQLTLLQAFQGGFVFYGGLIGGVIGLFIYVKHYKLNAFKFFELYATIVPLGHSIGRVGCFFGGCCYGIEYDAFVLVLRRAFPLYPKAPSRNPGSYLRIRLLSASVQPRIPSRR